MRIDKSGSSKRRPAYKLSRAWGEDSQAQPAAGTMLGVSVVEQHVLNAQLRLRERNNASQTMKWNFNELRCETCQQSWESTPLRVSIYSTAGNNKQNTVNRSRWYPIMTAVTVTGEQRNYHGLIVISSEIYESELGHNCGEEGKDWRVYTRRETRMWSWTTVF